jgi:hypothetical protein
MVQPQKPQIYIPGQPVDNPRRVTAEYVSQTVKIDSSYIRASQPVGSTRLIPVALKYTYVTIISSSRFQLQQIISTCAFPKVDPVVSG